MTSIWAMSWAMYGAVIWGKNHYMDPIFLYMVNYINLGYVLGYGLGCDLGKEPLYGFYTVNLDRNEPLNRLMPEIIHNSKVMQSTITLQMNINTL